MKLILVNIPHSINAHIYMTEEAEISRNTLLIGLFATVIGAAFILISTNIIPVEGSAFEAPRWIVALAGVVFFLGGLKAVTTDARFDYFRDTKMYAILDYLSIGLLLTSFAIIPTWIAFGPGERQIEGVISTPFLSVWFGTDANLGRIAFGFSAILIIVFAIVNWINRAVHLIIMIKQ